MPADAFRRFLHQALISLPYLPPPSFLPSGSIVDCYVRDSGGPRQEASTDQQLSEIATYCLQHGLILRHKFHDEARSGGSTIERNDFNRMVDLTRREEDRPAGLLLWNYARFARDLDDSIYYKALLRNRQIIVHSLTDPVPEGQYGRVVEIVIDISNEEKRRQTSADSRRGLHDLVREHGCVSGVPPRGFMRQPVDLGLHRDGSPRHAARWVPDPATAPLVRTAFEMRAAGASLAEIQAETHLYGGINSYATFWPNKIYLGILEFGGQVIENYCEPIVPRATWDAVQQIQGYYRGHHHVQSGSPNHPRRQNSKFILSGLARCARCGSPLFGHTSHQRNGSVLESYFCSRAYRKRDCVKTRIPRLPFENAVLSTLTDFILRPETMARARAELEAGLSGSLTEQRRQREELTGQLGRARRQIRHLTDAIAERGHSAALLNRLSDLENQETGLLTRISGLEASAIQPVPEVSAEQILANAEFLLAGFPSADIETKRAALHGLLDRVMVQREGSELIGTLYYFYPLSPPKALPPLEAGEPAVPIVLTPSGPPDE